MARQNRKQNFEVLPSDGHILIKMSGRLEADSAKSFSNLINEILSSQTPQDVILNFADVSVLTLPWIRTLMSLCAGLREVNKQTLIVCPSDEVIKFLKQEGVEGALRVHTSLRSALVDLGLVTAHTLDVNFINPFLAATMKVLELQTSTKVTPGKIYKKTPQEKFLGDISGVIGLVSEAFNGSVVISFPEATFLKVISRMMGEEYKEITKEIEDGAGEITNIIFGQAKVELNQKGYGIRTALPSVVSGADHSILQMTNGPRVVIPFETDAGPFFVEICISA